MAERRGRSGRRRAAQHQVYELSCGNSDLLNLFSSLSQFRSTLQTNRTAPKHNTLSGDGKKTIPRIKKCDDECSQTIQQYSVLFLLSGLVHMPNVLLFSILKN